MKAPTQYVVHVQQVLFEFFLMNNHDYPIIFYTLKGDETCLQKYPFTETKIQAVLPYTL